MKDETKSKLKKYGKRAGFGLALVSLFLLGVGVGACSARKAVGSSAEDNVDILASSPSYSNLGVDSYAEGNTWRVFTPNDGKLLRYTDTLPVGLYMVTFDMREYWGASFLVDDYMVGVFGTVYNQGHGNSSYVALSHAKLIFSEYNFARGTYFFRISEGDSLRRFATCGYDGQAITLSLVHEPVGEGTIDLGSSFYPAPMIGQTLNDSALFVYHGVSAGQVNLNLDFIPQRGFAFLSNGTLYNGVRLHLSGVGNLNGSQIERYMTRNGDIEVAPDLNLNFAVVNEFYYHDYFRDTWVKVWELPYNGSDQGFNYWSYNGRWLASAFRSVNVLYDRGDVGFSDLLPTLTLSQLLSLDVWQQGSTITIGDDYNNVFTMLSQGFSSVAGLLNIRILPFLTLGTLLFVPLIVLVLFAIIRILNK